MAHDVDGIWDLVQSNGFRVRVDIVQPRCPGGLADGELQGAAKENGRRRAGTGEYPVPASSLFHSPAPGRSY